MVEDVRDALEAALWYMRLEGGRYRFTTEPNLNKVVLEREGAIREDLIDTLVREAILAVAPSTAELRVEPRVAESADLPDIQQLTLGILGLDLRIGGDVTEQTVRVAREILEHRGSSWRANKNAAMLIASDAPSMARARASARTLAALRDLKADNHRLNRFNAEQREQLEKRLVASEERLPQQVTMAYRHLLMLRDGNGSGTKLDSIDLGPAKVDSKVGERVLDYLRSADQLIETTLAPAALLAARFGLLPDGTDAVELDALLGYFYRLPRLPKLVSPHVLRRALAEGVERALFGLASGSSWDAEDAGTWLVRAATAKGLLAQRGSGASATPSHAAAPPGPVAGEAAGEILVKDPAMGHEAPSPVGTVTGVTVYVRGVPGSKVREVVKVAILPLNAVSADVTVELVIQAEGGLTGIPQETLNLVVLEGLRQLGLEDVDVRIRQ
jgi:hypothetical protein